MILIELTRPAEEPVTIEEAKAFARIEGSGEDALLASLVGAAREAVEAETGLLVARRSFRIVLDAVPADGRVVLSRRPVRAVTSATAFSSDGEPRALPAEAVRVAREDVVILPAEAECGPAEVEIEAGLERAEVPQGVRAAILRIVAASYETRAFVEPGMQPALIPPLARSLLAPHRAVRL